MLVLLLKYFVLLVPFVANQVVVASQVKFKKVVGSPSLETLTTDFPFRRCTLINARPL